MTEQALKRLQSVCLSWGIPLCTHQSEQFINYDAIFRRWNSQMDLTNITDPVEVVDRHYLDSLAPLHFGPWPQAGKVLDVGSGAGLPGIPLAILCPDTHFVLIDAQKKRIAFLDEVISRLGLSATTIHARAEDLAHHPEHRAAYGLVVSRALAPLAVLAELLLPFVRPGGLALCYKGPAVLEEIPQGEKAVSLLGGALEPVVETAIEGRDWRHVLLPIRKCGATPAKYPRKAGIPHRRPLR